MLRKRTIKTNRLIARLTEILQFLFLVIRTASKDTRDFGLFLGNILEELLLKVVQRVVF